jgi:hypothetical protein
MKHFSPNEMRSAGQVNRYWPKGIPGNVLCDVSPVAITSMPKFRPKPSVVPPTDLP